MLRTISIARRIFLSPQHQLLCPVQTYSKVYLDKSKVPVLDEKELEEQFVRGSGPGGQATNKTNNCVMLKHLPTGVVVRCHETRYLEDNRKRARAHLVTRLDHLLNGENSVEAQTKREMKRRKLLSEAKARENLRLKKEFKEREGLD